MSRRKLNNKSGETNNIKERYHGPLITNGVSLGYIKIYPWISLPISLFLYFGGGYKDDIGIIKILFLTCVIINVLSILIARFNSLINRFKPLIYILIALVSWTVLVELTFIGLLMFVSNESSLSARTVYDSDLTLFYVIPMLLLFFLTCGFYAWHYLPQNQGKVWKINQWETYGVKVKGKKKERLTNFGAAFGVVLFVPAVLTGYIANAFGVFLGILLTSTLSAVIVDAFYAAVYIRKHPEDDSL
ncbi:hypothetical protein [Streptococcus macacae]|uniref:Membrane protein n=1 Tax=Streptococcus macacae NCTC 11558 TaxID=764298 RepID=G5JX99_9STRE|nr:hypothetical protein [Streptococcus macacae]EHJ51628.1 putative membrane protein [Streptococcus macacae NCTC 11558]SUN77873.1 membrane protein [Streptococcus macacae NCTC 11558]